MMALPCLLRAGSSFGHAAPPSHAHCTLSLSRNHAGLCKLVSCTLPRLDYLLTYSRVRRVSLPGVPVD